MSYIRDVVVVLAFIILKNVEQFLFEMLSVMYKVGESCKRETTFLFKKINGKLKEAYYCHQKHTFFQHRIN